jgi:hypothetical protein
MTTSKLRIDPLKVAEAEKDDYAKWVVHMASSNGFDQGTIAPSHG